MPDTSNCQHPTYWVLRHCMYTEDFSERQNMSNQGAAIWHLIHNKVRQREPTVCRNDTNSLSNVQQCCRYWGAHITSPTVWLVYAYTNRCLTVPPGSAFSVWVLPVGIKPVAPSVEPYCIKPSGITAVCIMLIQLDFSSYITQIKHVTLQYRFKTPLHGGSILELTLNIQDASHRKCSAALYCRRAGWNSCSWQPKASSVNGNVKRCWRVADAVWHSESAQHSCICSTNWCTVCKTKHGKM